MSDVGAATFVLMFQSYSTSKIFFPVLKESPLEDPKVKDVLQNHGLRVMRVSIYTLLRIRVLYILDFTSE